MHDPMCDVALDPGLVYLSDCYADASSENTNDFNVCTNRSTSCFSSSVLMTCK